MEILPQDRGRSASSCMTEMKSNFAPGNEIEPMICVAELVAMVSRSKTQPRCSLDAEDIQRSKRWANHSTDSTAKRLVLF